MPQITPFNQPSPVLANQYLDDRVLRSYLRRRLPHDIFIDVEPSLHAMGAAASETLYRLQQEHRLFTPHHIPFDAWGNRIDHIVVSPFWKYCEQFAAEHGLVAAAYDTPYREFSRLYQFALVYLFHPSTDVYTCPLAMTDGAARTLLRSGNTQLIERAVPHLTSRNPDTFWTSGQWMTESTGGSDVGQTETVAEQDSNGTWRLYGRKWFTSAVTSQIALTLARPTGNPSGGDGLALFYVELRNDAGQLQNITVQRLKDKLGTKQLPTAELLLHGTPAIPVYDTRNGIRNIVPMLHITRTWNSVCAISFMRRGIALARDYARKRYTFGSLLSKKPLHADTLASMQAEFEAAFHLVFFTVSLLGKDEAHTATDDERRLFRILSSIAKLTSGKQGVALTSETVESFGGAGYVEDTGIATLLRDAQVLPIWEGTTNVLALDTLKSLSNGGLELLYEQIHRLCAGLRDKRLQACGNRALQAIQHTMEFVQQCVHSATSVQLEASARRIAFTLGRALALALLADHAEWSLAHESDERPRAAACRFAQQGVDMIESFNLDETFALAHEV
ncbi:MAG: acyl-CoA dehydrogenase family protein [Bacteroidota bacterium]|nr:acyl-CoA dehydrogenase family protein [Candidatus Kapabacteria bacterium]MDW8220094.1 acyl-CoA dehydrogenase family protein [Bacteroidota bacterium]